MKVSTRVQLSGMMFLQFFVWGGWFVTLGTYLSQIGFDGVQIGNAYSTSNWGAILAPFFVGMIADRFFSAEKVLAIMHLLGGVVMFKLAGIQEPGAFFGVAMLYCLCYMPTLALVNAISFNQMQNPEKEFPSIRVLGTLGWIVAGLVIGSMPKIMGWILDPAAVTAGTYPAWVLSLTKSIEPTAIPMKISAGASLLLGVYALLLPKTPPKSAGKKISLRDILGLDTLKLMKEKSFAVFVICSFLVCIPLAFYYNFTNMFLNEMKVEGAASKMTFGQMSEVFFMLVMPFFFARLGVKKMLLFGMLAWAIRYVLFAFGNAQDMIWMYYGGILLHGICYDFFFVTGQIYVDQKAPAEIRANAQGFIALVTYGAGMVVGCWVSGFIVDQFVLLQSNHKAAGHLWQWIWITPALMAFGVLVIFALLFKENRKAAEACGCGCGKEY